MRCRFAAMLECGFTQEPRSTGRRGFSAKAAIQCSAWELHLPAGAWGGRTKNQGSARPSLAVLCHFILTSSIWELLQCLFLQTPLIIQSLSAPAPPVIQAVPQLSGAQKKQPFQSLWDRPRLMHEGNSVHKSHTNSLKNTAGPPALCQLRLPRSAVPALPARQHRGVPWLFGRQSSSLSPSREPDRIQNSSGHQQQSQTPHSTTWLSHSSMPVKRDNHCQPGPIREQWWVRKPHRWPKSTTEPGMCQPPHSPKSHSACQHWEIPHSFPSHALFLFPSPSSLEKTASSSGRPSLSVQSQALLQL